MPHTHRPHHTALAAALLATLAAALSGCLLPTTPPAASATQPAAAYTLTATSARNQKQFLPLTRLNLPDTPAQITLTIHSDSPLPPSAITPYLLNPRTTTVTSPAVDQLLATPSAQADNGSTLSPLPCTDSPAARTFSTPRMRDLVLHLNIPPTQPPGTYTATLTLTPPAPAAPITLTTTLTVSDVLLPFNPAALTLATTTTDALDQLFPADFGNIQPAYLDRADPAHAPAIARLDALVAAAHKHNIALFVEDVAPVLQLDSVGRVSLDWDAYDRTLAPYMDGTAFPDRKPLQAWLAPAPPRRIRESPAQLRQYWQACIAHHKAKAWEGQIVLLHPAQLDPNTSPALLATIQTVLKQLDPNVAVATLPGINTPQQPLWATCDQLPQLPPTGPLATPASVRAWPWLAPARNLAGILWRDAVGPQIPPANPASMPLLTVDNNSPQETLRLAWLLDGINDAARAALLAKRSDPKLAAELLAGVVGQTAPRTPANTPATATAAASPFPPPPPGYVYPAWPENPDLWDKLPAMMDTLIAMYEPGAAVTLANDDPQALRTRMWLAEAHRPGGRVSGYRFALTPSRDGPVLSLATEITLQNPIAIPTALSLAWDNLPGDLQLQPATLPTLPPHGTIQHLVTAEGHLSPLSQPTTHFPLAITERHGGALLSLPVRLPLHRMKPTPEPLRIDGSPKDWPNPATGHPNAPGGLWGLMTVDLPYAARPDLNGGKPRAASNPATVQWTYDNDFLYALVTCPQNHTSDQRNSEWPLQNNRWWGTDGIQLQIAGGTKLDPGTRVIHVAVKPSGTVLTRAALLAAGQRPVYTDAPQGLRYAIQTDKNAYTVELAIPRKWFPTSHDADPDTPAWRINVLRHQESTHTSTSWSGPLLDDTDLPMMGLLTGALR